jgi:hypothetical protein
MCERSSPDDPSCADMLGHAARAFSSLLYHMYNVLLI